MQAFGKQRLGFSMGFFGKDWGPLTAAATCAIVPILLVFTFLGKQLISGLTAGAVKG